MVQKHHEVEAADEVGPHQQRIAEVAGDRLTKLARLGDDGHETGLCRQQPDDERQQRQADEADAEKSVLPVTKPAGQQTADHPAGDAPQRVGGNVDPDGGGQGPLAELFPHVGDGSGGQPRQQNPLQDPQQQQLLKLTDQADEQGEQDGAGQTP